MWRYAVWKDVLWGWMWKEVYSVYWWKDRYWYRYSRCLYNRIGREPIMFRVCSEDNVKIVGSWRKGGYSISTMNLFRWRGGKRRGRMHGCVCREGTMVRGKEGWGFGRMEWDLPRYDLTDPCLSMQDCSCSCSVLIWSDVMCSQSMVKKYRDLDYLYTDWTVYRMRVEQ